ncbi:nuclear transport factor 2 family protein [Spirosoma sp. HMF4905]|uniref:Nuclear transport factor 2 family protein n=1 Tax=Spirosoma arboris TaxID=2682092 RepID=A0A7K1SLU4_9BACT|nr:nuclear transport factor 2 family protein [Spirosoma arboris]MVM34779.1 nuclear transport factor 2 family protein [Spirosoma arboris]
MNQDKINIAKASYDAFARQDRTAIEKLMAPDLSFTSPVDNQLDRKTYFERCWPNGDLFEAFKFIYLVSLNDQIFVTYEASRKDGAAIRNTEILTIQNDQIVNIEVYWGWNIPHPAKIGDSVPEEGK